MMYGVKKLENTEETNKLIATLYKKVISMNLYEPDFKACLFLYPEGIYLHWDKNFSWTSNKNCVGGASQVRELETMIQWLDEAYQEFKKISDMRKKSRLLEDPTPEHIKDLEDSKWKIQTKY